MKIQFWLTCGVAFAFLATFAICLISPDSVAAQPTVATPRTLTLEETVRLALENNPQLASIRQQHGIAAAAVVIAKTYPFNPIYQSNVLYARGPDTAVVENPVLHTHQVTLEVQLFHQQRYRKQAAFAALTRTDWEIATQELTFAVNSIRAFDALLYRDAKLAVTEEFLRLNEQAADQVKKLVDAGTLKAGDLILTRAEVNDIRSQLGMNRTAIVAATKDYVRALGLVDAAVVIRGTLERPAPPDDLDRWLKAAYELRPDRFARLAAVSETAADVRFQRADRFGNPQIGPVYEYDDSRTQFIGAKIQLPFPLLNLRPGEIQLAKARLAQAHLNVRQIDIEIKQDVTLALERVKEASQWLTTYRQDVLPALRKSLDDMNELFRQGQPGVDVLRVLDVRRKLLRAQDGYLDALLAYTSALADLALAVGDPCLAMGLHSCTADPIHCPANQPTGKGNP